MNVSPPSREDPLSQIPALQVLHSLGFTYLTPAEATRLRRGRKSEVLLTGILENWLRENNSIRYKGQTYAFSEGNIQEAVQALKPPAIDALVRMNEKIYDLLCLGKSLPQSIDGDVKSFSLRYINWEQPEKNVFHVTEEFDVERTGQTIPRTPDLVLFVNGIPFVVIECKRPGLTGDKPPVELGIEQQIRNQKEDEIPRLFHYSQILLSLGVNAAKYATTGTSEKFWSVWKEEADVSSALREIVNRPLPSEFNDLIFSRPDRDGEVRTHFAALAAAGPREITEQDRALYGLCRPERLIELTHRFIVYDQSEKKVARYQQYFCVKKIMARITTRTQDGGRQGGVVWHTQGSGKSLTMVMLAKAIALADDIENHKIVLVTDRVDLDDQIYRTFVHCGKELEQATTGAHLAELLEGANDRIVTTVIDKFEAALRKKDVVDENPNIFVLVDESHRTQYGPRHALMQKVLPNACYIGFTGTPLMKQDKNTMAKFGGLIDTYTITQAVHDKAVVPLLYEGREVGQVVDGTAIDAWFERETKNLARDQQADLKRKYSTSNTLNKAEQRIKQIAFDVSAHFHETWQGTPFKAQLVAPSKATALKFKAYLDEFGMVSSEVMISAPDDREGDTDIYEENTDAVVRFWNSMMKRYGGEKEYRDQIINSFKHGEKPEIIIVVSKLLTGFDAPCNTVLYLAKPMKGHDLLQAIARVNRLHDGKDFGYIIDYVGVLSELNKALDLYGKMTDFEQSDLLDTLTDIREETAKLAQRHSDLWALFQGLRNKRDQEAYELHLHDHQLRVDFYDRLSAFARTLQVALSSVTFMNETEPAKIQRYKDDLKFFINLRTSVRRRYAEAVDFKEYEAKIQKLIDAHVGAREIETITPLVNIFDTEAFKKEVEKQETPASKADTIAHRTLQTIHERWDEDPAFYRKFSKILEEAIAAFHARRLSDADYLGKVTSAFEAVRDRTGEQFPMALREREVARAFFNLIQEMMQRLPPLEQTVSDEVALAASLAIDDIIQREKIVNWTTNSDIQNQMRIAMEDCLYDLKEKHALPLTFEDTDAIIESCLDIARVRYRT